VVGAQAVPAGRELADALDAQLVGADAADPGAQRVEEAAQALDVRLAGRVQITVRPSASTAAITVFSVPVTLISSRKTSVPGSGPRASGGRRAGRDARAQLAQREQVCRAAAGRSGRRRAAAAPPAPSARAGPAPTARSRGAGDITAVGISALEIARVQARTVPWSSTSTRTPRWRSPSSNALTSRMRGTLSTTTGPAMSRQAASTGRPVLVAGRRHRPPQGVAALHQEAISGHVSLLVNTNRARGH
jgi:hypothetical protein